MSCHEILFLLVNQKLLMNQELYISDEVYSYYKIFEKSVQRFSNPRAEFISNTGLPWDPGMNKNLLFGEFNMATVYLATLNMSGKFNTRYQIEDILKVTFPELYEQLMTNMLTTE